MLDVLWPLFRYDGWRNAWILRGIGNRFGPVLVPSKTAPTTSTRRGQVVRRRAAIRRLVVAHEGSALVESLVPRLRPLVALSLVLVAAVLGFAIAQITAGSSPMRPAHASAGLLDVSIPQGWRRQPTRASRRIPLTDELALSPARGADGTLLVGRVAGPAATRLPGLLKGAPARAVTVGGARFDVYPVRAKNGSAESVYVLPTRFGEIVGVCLPRAAGAGFENSCKRILASVTISSSTAPRLSASYAAGLNAAMTNLDAVRSSAGRELRSAPNALRQSRAAAALAAAHATAARTLLRLDAGPASTVNTAIIRALRITSAAYSRLSLAASSTDLSGYSAAKVAVAQASAKLDAALAMLREFGYRIS